jgi:hypothetical protein
MKIVRQARSVRSLRRCHLIRCSSVQPLAPSILGPIFALTAIRSR